MKPIAVIAVIVVLFVAGAGGGYLYLSQRGGEEAPAVEPASSTEARVVDSGSPEHGRRIIVPEGAAMCSEHHVAEVICPFCKPSLIEELGYCGGHDVAEALCTRCNPALIAAFKAEGDWCAEHGLPESQCLVCNPSLDG